MSTYEERQENNVATNRFRSSLNVGMGIIYVLIGSTVVYMKYFGVVALNNGLAYALGGLMILYGLFRLWRGLRDLRLLKQSKIKRQFDDIGKN